MEQKLYDQMDWAGIEELVYSEASDPHKLLGPHVTEDGLLVQAFIPTAVSITVKLTGNGKKYPMEMADEAGFFAVLIPRKSVTPYTLLVEYEGGGQEEIHDPYAFAPLYTDEDIKKFAAGIHYAIYEKMGAHPMTINGVEGVYFSVWAPCAMRVSVVGDFNQWDGRRHQMRRVGWDDACIFELFIPGLKQGDIYKYEIKTRHGEPMLKADPYANYAELRPNTASIVWDVSRYQWKDKEWMARRAKTDTKDKPMNIYEVHLGSWMRKDISMDEEGNPVTGSESYNYREIAEKRNVDSLRETFYHNLPVLRERFYMDLLKGRIKAEDMDELMKEYQIGMNRGGAWVAGIIEITMPENQNDGLTIHKEHLAATTKAHFPRPEALRTTAFTVEKSQCSELLLG